MAIKATIGSWRAEYVGGRTADVFHVTKGHALDCVEVGDFDWNPPGGGFGRQTTEVSKTDVRDALENWITEVGSDYERELPYL